MRKRTKVIVATGIVCALMVGAAVWYSLTYNDGRLVKPIDSSFEVISQDIPMIIALSATILYGLVLCGMLMYAIIKNFKERLLVTHKRELNPKLGLFGFCGFLGFLGFWTYSTDKMIFPFCFFMFLGFFGFFFEGKMSGTFMDERFKENARKAQLSSLKIGFAMIWISLLLLGRGHRFFVNLEYIAIAYTIVISLALAVVVFLSEYLLYRYDHDAQNED